MLLRTSSISCIHRLRPQSNYSIIILLFGRNTHTGRHLASLFRSQLTEKLLRPKCHSFILDDCLAEILESRGRETGRRRISSRTVLRETFSTLRRLKTRHFPRRWIRWKATTTDGEGEGKRENAGRAEGGRDLAGAASLCQLQTNRWRQHGRGL